MRRTIYDFSRKPDRVPVIPHLAAAWYIRYSILLLFKAEWQCPRVALVLSSLAIDSVSVLLTSINTAPSDALSLAQA
eukprot:scaffold377_cov563-Prasinococcus_capsulatus_cf.AAC.7